MAALHEALQTLSPVEFATLPLDQLEPFLAETFKDAQLLIDSVPIPAAADVSLTPVGGRSRSNTVSSVASSASGILSSSARPSPPAPRVEALQSQWGKPVRLNAKDNPLGISVYKLAGKDGRGAWFARRSVHEGLGFARWKRGLEKEFPETMKVQGAPGEGNIRGIGGERRVEHRVVPGLGKMDVYHLSAQFPGPTTPRDFVTLLLTSDSALTEECAGVSDDKEIPRHFMVVSKACIHPDCPEREGFIRGQYQSVEFIREIPLNKGLKKSASATNLKENDHSRGRSDSTSLGKEAILRNAQKAQHESIGEARSADLLLAPSDANSSSPEGRRRGKTVSYSQTRGWDVGGRGGDDAGDSERNPVEWIMLTRSDPGGSVPRFMVERGTPSSIVADAVKFLDWACSTEIDEPDETAETSDSDRAAEKPGRKSHDYGLMNGHLAGLDGSRDPAPIEIHGDDTYLQESGKSASGSIYSMVAGAVGAAGTVVASHTPAVIANRFPGHAPAPDETTRENPPSGRQISASSTESDSDSDSGSFVSAYEGNAPSPAASTGNVSQRTTSSFVRSRPTTNEEKELIKLEDRKRKLNERIAKTRERERSKKSEDSEKEAQAIARAEEKHQKEVAKQEEKYRREMAKLASKRDKEERKAEEKRQKALQKDERAQTSRELDALRAERDILRVERDLLRKAMGDLQAENTALAARVGKLGALGEQVLRDVRDEVVGSGSARLRATTVMGGSKASSIRSMDVTSSSFTTTTSGSASGSGSGIGSGLQKENTPPAPR